MSAKNPQYTEGDQALANFERGMKAVFQVSKKRIEARKRRQQKAITVRKTKKPDNGKA